MLDYGELSKNPHHLNRNNESWGSIDDWSIKNITNWASGGVDSDDITAIKGAEEKMLTDLSKLKTDPVTGLPVVSEQAQEIKGMEEEKADKIGGILSKGTDAESKKAAKLYKMGVRGHGAVEATERNLGEDIKRDMTGVTRDYKSTLYDAEQKALATLEGINKSVTDVPGEYKVGAHSSTYRDISKRLFEPGKYETEGKYDPYTVANLGGEVNPMDVLEEAYEYDYTTGKPKKTGVV